MGTALAVTQQQSIEVADPRWARIHNTDRCPRCSGLMVAEWCQDLSDYRLSAACNVARLSIRLFCRTEAAGRMNSACREDVAEQLRDERSYRRRRRNSLRRLPLG